MIQTPRRSVTRFFIPLIDVLTLLFCIFLMMPVVKKSSEAEAADALRADQLTEREHRLEQRERQADAKQRELRQELDRLRRETAQEVMKQLATRVLEIDPSNGKLYYRNPDRVEVRDEADARALIRRDRDGPGGPHEVYYVILYPRDADSEYPHKAQREQYERWFADVPVKYDRPFAEAEEGKQP